MAVFTPVVAMTLISLDTTSRLNDLVSQNYSNGMNENERRPLIGYVVGMPTNLQVQLHLYYV